MAKKKERRRQATSFDSGFEMSPGSSSSINVACDEEKSSKCFSNIKDELEEMYVSMMNVLNAVKSHEDSGPFLNPVNEDYAPGYFTIIKEPMDISVMESKILLKTYKSRKQFEKDFRKMVNNCEIFNGVGNAYTNMAYNIWRVFNKSMKKHFSKCSYKLKAKKEPSQVEPCSKTDCTSSHPQSKTYICTSNNVDGAIKITIKQTEAKVVPPTTLHSVKSGENRKLCFQIKKELAPLTKKNQNNLSLSYEMRKNELPTRRAALQGPKTNPNNPPLNAIRRRKRKKKPVSMKALEALAQAAERALKDAASRSSFDDDTFSSHSNSPIYNSSAFPDLKISTTQSHPASLLHRLYSKTLSDSSIIADKDLNANKPNKIEKEDFKSVLESKNDISSIFPSAADTLVFPRNVIEPMHKVKSECKEEISVFDLTRPCINVQRCKTKFSDSEDDSTAGESDSFMEDFESLNPMTSLYPENFPKIKPCQVTLSRLSPRQYYRGNKVRILEKVKEEKKRKKRRSKWNAQAMYRRELRSNALFIGEATNTNDDKVEDRIVNITNATSPSFSPPLIKEYVPSPEPKFNVNEPCDETNFQQYWGKNNVPPRKRYSALMPTPSEKQLLFEKNQSVKKETSSIDTAPIHNFASLPIDMTQVVLGAPKCQDNDIIKEEIDNNKPLDIGVNYSTESKSSAASSFSTFQFENISDSSSDEGYTTNERVTPVFHSKNQWYYNTLTSRLFGADMLAGQNPKTNNLNNELLFGNTPFGNSDLPNEKNGFSFEAQCQRQTDYFQHIKPSFIDFSMLTPLNLEIPLPNYCQPLNANSYVPQNGLRDSNSGLVKTSSSILYNENLNEPADLRTLPY